MLRQACLIAVIVMVGVLAAIGLSIESKFKDRPHSIKAEIRQDRSGMVDIGSGRIFTFSVADGHLIIKDDSGSVIGNRIIREPNGEEKNDIEILGIACEESGGYFD